MEDPTQTQTQSQTQSQSQMQTEMQTEMQSQTQTQSHARVHFALGTSGGDESSAAAGAKISRAADAISEALAASSLACAEPSAGTGADLSADLSAKPSAVTPEVEERAREFIARTGMDASDREGLLHMQNLTLSMGLHTARACFRAMLDANNITGAARAAAEREITAFSPVTEIGCMRVDFFNMLTAGPDVAYLVLEQCPAGHNLSAQMHKLHRLVDGDKWIEVLKHLSMLVHLGRSVYNQIAQQNLPLLRRIYKRGAGDACADLMQLGVDSRNTTLFVDPRWPMRVGIFVKLASEVEDGGSAP